MIHIYEAARHAPQEDLVLNKFDLEFEIDCAFILLDELSTDFSFYFSYSQKYFLIFIIISTCCTVIFHCCKYTMSYCSCYDCQS